MALTAKQQRFVDEYLVDLNATQAAIRAGYSPRTANEQASRLLANVSVRAAVEAAKAGRSARTQITADAVLRELLLVATSDIGQVLDFSGADPRLRPACEIPEAARRAIASVKVRRTLVGPEDDRREVEVTEFKLWDKLSALDKIARHLGLLVPRDPDDQGGRLIEIRTVSVARPAPIEEPAADGPPGP